MIRTTKINAKDDVAADLREALEVVSELDPPDDLRLAVFTQAANMLTYRVAEQVAPGLAAVAPPSIIPGA